MDMRPLYSSFFSLVDIHEKRRMDDLAGASGSWIHMGGVFLLFTPFADITSFPPRTTQVFGLRGKAPRESSNNIIIHASILLISRLVFVLFCCWWHQPNLSNPRDHADIGMLLDSAPDTYYLLRSPGYTLRSPLLYNLPFLSEGFRS